MRDEATVYERLHGDLVAHLVQEVLRLADEASLGAVRRGRPSDQPDVRIALLHLGEKGAVTPLALARNEMRLVHHDDVERFEEIRVSADRLNARDYDRLPRVPAVESRRVDPDLQLRADRPNLRRVLLDQLLDVRKA